MSLHAICSICCFCWWGVNVWHDSDHCKSFLLGTAMVAASRDRWGVSLKKLQKGYLTHVCRSLHIPCYSLLLRTGSCLFYSQRLEFADAIHRSWSNGVGATACQRTSDTFPEQKSLLLMVAMRSFWAAAATFELSSSSAVTMILKIFLSAALDNSPFEA